MQNGKSLRINQFQKRTGSVVQMQAISHVFVGCVTYGDALAHFKSQIVAYTNSLTSVLRVNGKASVDCQQHQVPHKQQEKKRQKIKILKYWRAMRIASWNVTTKDLINVANSLRTLCSAAEWWWSHCFRQPNICVLLVDVLRNRFPKKIQNHSEDLRISQRISIASTIPHYLYEYI